MERINVTPYNPKWASLYDAQQGALKEIFANLPVSFRHIGSTAIRECWAKPKIDILGVTRDILEIDRFNSSLDKLGYQALGEYGMKQRRFFQKRGEVEVNLHIFEDSDPEVARHLRFVHYLRTHPQEREAYSKLKRQLAKKYPNDILQYTLAKEEFVHQVDRKAALEDKGIYWHKGNLPRRTTWSDKQILDAMEANLYLHLTYFSKYTDKISLVFQSDILVVHSPIEDDTFNYVVGAKFEKENLKSRVQAILSLFDDGAHPFSWWVGPRDTPKELANELVARGLSLKEEVAGMFLFLDQLDQEETESTLKVMRALKPEDLSDFGKIYASLQGYPRFYEHLLSDIPPVLYGEGSPYEIYVGYFEGSAVVTGIVVLHANVAGIYYIMTNPAYRKRGFGTEMTLFLLHRAKEKGYLLSTLQASQAGKRIYDKLGFHKICDFVEYAKPRRI